MSWPLQTDLNSIVLRMNDFQGGQIRLFDALLSLSNRKPSYRD